LILLVDVSVDQLRQSTDVVTLHGEGEIFAVVLSHGFLQSLCGHLVLASGDRQERFVDFGSHGKGLRVVSLVSLLGLLVKARLARIATDTSRLDEVVLRNISDVKHGTVVLLDVLSRLA
jgi:hypothetical protein